MSIGRCGPGATRATRAHTVTGGLTSPARLSRFFAVREGDKVHGTCRRKVHSGLTLRRKVAFSFPTVAARFLMEGTGREKLGWQRCMLVCDESRVCVMLHPDSQRISAM